MAAHLNQPIVLDLGSGLTKAGFAGSAEPVAVLGSVVGTPKLRRILPSAAGSGVDSADGTLLGVGAAALPDTGRSRYAAAAATNGGGGGRRASSAAGERVVGERLRALAGVVALSNPLQRGAVTDWEGAEMLWRHAVSDVLRAEHGSHAALVTENAHNPAKNREKIAHFFFESLRVPALYVAAPPVLALYASGRTSGVVLDVGDTVATALAVAEGHAASARARRLDVGGRDVAGRLALLMRKSGAALGATSSEREAVRRAKERLCYVAQEPAAEESRAREGRGVAKFELPDGNELFLGAERFRAPEMLFRPELVGAENCGVGELVQGAVQDADMELRRRLYGSVLLAVCMHSRWLGFCIGCISNFRFVFCFVFRFALRFAGRYNETQGVRTKASHRAAGGGRRRDEGAHPCAGRSAHVRVHGRNDSGIVDDLPQHGHLVRRIFRARRVHCTSQNLLTLSCRLCCLGH